MATTIPNVIRALGNAHPDGFTTRDLVMAFMDAGYGPEKAVRRTKVCVKGLLILPHPENDPVTEKGEKKRYVSKYCAYHRNLFPEYFDMNPIRAVKIERDGSFTILG